MTIMTFAAFKKLTAKNFSLRNGAIGDIDAALKAYHTPPATKDKLNTLKQAIDAFKQVKNLKHGNYTQSGREGKSGVTLLGTQVAEALKPAPLVTPSTLVSAHGNLRQVQQGPVGAFPSGTNYRVGAENTRMEGWSYAPFDPVEFSWTSAITSGFHGALSLTQTSRVTEALRRTKMALGFAHRAMVRISKVTSFSSPATTEEALYISSFGSYDARRIARVMRNFTVLKLAIDRGPRIVDMRDTDYGLRCYAACFRGTLGQTDGGTGQVSVLSALTVFLGRAFFVSGTMNYGDSTDATVGTLVHEFAHGAINAVDVPPVDASGTWLHARESDIPTDTNFGASTDNSVQASTATTVRLLGQHKPDYAIVNADSYGQFASGMLRHYGG
nr:hypothetical protein [Dyella sp. ASV24]